MAQVLLNANIKPGIDSRWVANYFIPNRSPITQTSTIKISWLM
jgi:hypothetical protein